LRGAGIFDCGLGIADCGLKKRNRTKAGCGLRVAGYVLRGAGIFDCGLGIADCGLKKRNRTKAGCGFVAWGRAHGAWRVEQDDSKPGYLSSGFCSLSFNIRLRAAGSQYPAPMIQ
jgi:hypothetical protein